MSSCVNNINCNTLCNIIDILTNYNNDNINVLYIIHPIDDEHNKTVCIKV